jgi:hypothetical protein
MDIRNWVITIILVIFPAAAFAERVYEVTGEYVVTNRTKSAQTVTLRAVMPVSSFATRVLHSEIVPTGTYFSNADGTESATVVVKLPPQARCSVSLQMTAQTFGVDVFTNEDFWVHELSPAEWTNLIRPSEKIESGDSGLKKLAVALSHVSQTDREVFESYVKAARNAFRTNSVPNHESGALAVMKKKSDDAFSCACFAAALCRAKGIPARAMAAVSPGTTGVAREAVVEAFVKGWGWVPAMIGKEGGIGYCDDDIVSVDAHFGIVDGKGNKKPDEVLLEPVWSCREVK